MFMQYMLVNQTDFIEMLTALKGEYSWVESDSKRKDEQIAARLRTGKVLNQMLEEFRYTLTY